MNKNTESKRCPFCMTNGLRSTRQTWSFKDEVNRTPTIEIEMFCDSCEKRSTWRWVENE